MGPDKHVAWHVLCAVLRAIRDRVPPDLAAHFGVQLPLIVRGAYYDQYKPAATVESDMVFGEAAKPDPDEESADLPGIP